MKRGFSLMEVMVASAIAIVIATIAVQATMMTNGMITRLRREAPVQIDARLLVDFLFEQVQEAGGGFVRPWHAVAVDDSCTAATGLPTCGGAGTSDRLRVFLTDATKGPCTITARTATLLTSTALDTNGDGTNDTCCPVQNAMGGNVVALTDPMNTAKVEFFHAGTPTTTVASCTVPLLNAGAAVVGMPNVPITAAIAAGTPAQLTGGRVFVFQVDASTVTAGTKDLVRYEDTSHNNIYDAAERSVIAPRVYDLQAALAYDGAPADGRLTEAGTTTDEWLGTIASDVFPSGANVTQLRMVRFGVVVGTRSSAGTPAQSPRILNRTTAINEPTMWLEAAVGSAYLRNIFLFEQ